MVGFEIAVLQAIVDSYGTKFRSGGRCAQSEGVAAQPAVDPEGIHQPLAGYVGVTHGAGYGNQSGRQRRLFKNAPKLLHRQDPLVCALHRRIGVVSQTRPSRDTGSACA